MTKMAFKPWERVITDIRLVPLMLFSTLQKNAQALDAKITSFTV